MTRSETVLTALLARLQTIAGPTVERNAGLTFEVPPDGRIVLQDGDPGDPDVTFSPLEWHYQHRAEVEIFAQAHPQCRDALFDDIKAAVGAVLAADRRLGGLVDWMEPMAPKAIDLNADGAAPVKAASITVVLQYSATDPLT